ncbi:MAG: hypothetical protein JXR96_28140 [Deltaproteobacteria bacterium]|nr:hypothetical protein [Deltaproteobacteria bacterium]
MGSSARLQAPTVPSSRPIGAYALDQAEDGKKAGGPPDYAKVFPRLFESIKDDFVSKRKETIRRNLSRFLARLDGEELDPKDAARAEEMLKRLKDEHGYCEKCAAEAMGYLLSVRG